MKAWHFCSISDDGAWHARGTHVVIGETLRVEGDLRLCSRGLHASRSVMDALSYSPGPVVCRVDVGGTIIHGDDKLVASARTVLWGYDATEVLRAFSRRCALDVIHLWDAPEVVVRYLRTGDESIRDAAWAAARDAAWDARGAEKQWQTQHLLKLLGEEVHSMETDMKKTFIVETETVVTRRYRVVTRDNPWGVCLIQGDAIGMEYGEEKPVTVTRIKED